jgi:phosphatidylinositol alpha-1,6-mannosyltransferase
LNVLFINLTAFSKTGGLEKFNKCFLKALQEFELMGMLKAESISLHDKEADDEYFKKEKYKGFENRRFSFVWKSVWAARKSDVVILGHINLALVGWLIKKIAPSKKLVLITHGVEVWQPLGGIKKKLLEAADLVLAVSNFTRDKLISVQKTDPEKVKIFFNAIDPSFSIPKEFAKNISLRNRYGLKDDDFVLYTLTRLSSGEKYKGYDVVIKCLPGLLNSIPGLKYIIAGKYDKEEKARVDQLIAELKLEDVVILAGYISDHEVKDHYQMSDLFIMPSQGEGFGIVFIEAMICGLPVIAGNLDGSVDALQNGELGLLVNPNSVEEITAKVLCSYQNQKTAVPADKLDLQKKTLSYFGFDQYKKRLQTILQTN